MGRRSWTASQRQAHRVGQVAVQLGLALQTPTGNYRDARTGRPITSHLAFLARLPIPWDTPTGQAWLRSVWEAVCASGKRTVQKWVLWLNGPRRRHPHRRSLPRFPQPPLAGE